MIVTPLALPGVLMIEPTVHGDDRGFFLESYNERTFTEHGLPVKFVQDNHARSRRGTLRGLHYQRTCPQGKLVTVVRGEAFDVAVDIRRGSPTFAKWVGVHLSGERPQFVWIPPGFAHGYCALSDTVDFQYKVTSPYDRSDDRGIHWRDSEIGIDWPIADPVISNRDAGLPTLRAALAELPMYDG